MNQTAGNLRELIMGFRITQLIHTAAKLKIADLLSERPGSAHELAEQTGADPRALTQLDRHLSELLAMRRE